jgi:hypothetical protein
VHTLSISSTIKPFASQQFSVTGSFEDGTSSAAGAQTKLSLEFLYICRMQVILEGSLCEESLNVNDEFLYDDDERCYADPYYIGAIY